MSEEIPAPPEPTQETTEQPSLVNQPQAEPEAKPEEAKPEETKPESPVEILADDFKELLPEGANVDDPSFKTFLEVVNNKELDAKARAQELFKLHAKALSEASERGTEAFFKMQEDWRTQVTNDPVFAGGKLEPALGGISKLLDKYGSAETREAFDFTGAGNHPAVIKFLHAMAKDLNEPGPDPIKAQPTVPAKSLAERLFPNQGR